MVGLSYFTLFIGFGTFFLTDSEVCFLAQHKWLYSIQYRSENHIKSLYTSVQSTIGVLADLVNKVKTQATLTHPSQ